MRRKRRLKKGTRLRRSRNRQLLQAMAGHWVVPGEVPARDGPYPLGRPTPLGSPAFVQIFITLTGFGSLKAKRRI